MCGIAGILSFEGSVQREHLKKMADAIMHRGPDGEGFWNNQKGNIGLAHRRLSIIDLSDTGCQPMHYADDRYTIIYNGEIYNYIELKEFLLQKNYTFHSTSDTEVILALYDLKKEKSLNDLDGMFAFAIWDEKEKVLFCARDRFGEKPFYYYKDKNFFAFASEIKALFQLDIPRVIDMKHVYDYLLYGTGENIHEPHTTFFQNINQLEASHYFTLSADGVMNKKRYWNIDFENTAEIDEKKAEEQFTELFTTSVKRRLRSDVPVGSSLSGGLDSSSIVMMIDKIKQDKQQQKTFSARFPDYAKDETPFMNLVIQNSNVEPHFVFPSAESILDNFQKITYHHEWPVGSMSVTSQYEVMKLAKENHIKVLLDGQGADEILAGYPMYWSYYLMQLFREDKKKYRKVKLDLEKLHGQEIRPSSPLQFLLQSYSQTLYNRLQNTKRRMQRTDARFFNGIAPELVEKYREEKNPIYKPSHLKEILYHSTIRYGLNELLRYADRNSMAHSVEVRLPFLSHRLVEFVFRLPEEFLIHNGWTKYILRKSMSPILPKEIAWRKDKIGYEPPQEQWLNSPGFKEYLAQSIAYLQKEKIISYPSPLLTWHYIALYSLLNISWNGY
jgi:asparagine synthase (glutamine-hydrolysing)